MSHGSLRNKCYCSDALISAHWLSNLAGKTGIKSHSTHVPKWGNRFCKVSPMFQPQSAPTTFDKFSFSYVLLLVCKKSNKEPYFKYNGESFSEKCYTTNWLYTINYRKNSIQFC